MHGAPRPGKERLQRAGAHIEPPDAVAIRAAQNIAAVESGVCVLHEHVAVRQGRVAFVDAGEARHGRFEKSLFLHLTAVRTEIQRSAPEGIGHEPVRRALRIRKKRPRVAVGYRRLQHDAVAFRARIGRVHDTALRPEEITDVFAAAVPRNHGMPGRLGGIPAPVLAPRLQPFDIRDQPAARNHDVLPGEPHVVQHARMRRFEAPLLRDISRAVEAAHEYVA